MFRISLLIKGILVLFLISFSLVSPAQSGMVDEYPVVSIQNRTNELPSNSPFYNKDFMGGTIYFSFQEPGWNNPGTGDDEPPVRIPIPVVSPGQVENFYISWPSPPNFNPSDDAIIYWSFYGVIDTNPIYAFPVGTQVVVQEPLSAPLLELGIASGLADPRPTPIFGFASPGILMGEATFSTTPVPEPTTMLLLGSGLIGLAGYGRKKFFKK